jgi:hypothetical protein
MSTPMIWVDVPVDVDDFRQMVWRALTTPCPCLESPHLNAVHDVAADVGPLVDEVEVSREILAAIRAEVEPWADRILRDAILAILDGPTP